MSIMQKRESNIVDIDQMMNERFGEVGTESRNAFRRDAYNYCVGQLIYEARNLSFSISYTYNS